MVQRQSLTRVPAFGWLISYPNPFRRALIPFGAVVDPKAPQYPEFLSPPRLALQMRHPGAPAGPEGSRSAEEAADAVFRTANWCTACRDLSAGTGTYEYTYRLAGNTGRGAFGINSPAFTVTFGTDSSSSCFSGCLCSVHTASLRPRRAAHPGRFPAQAYNTACSDCARRLSPSGPVRRSFGWWPGASSSFQRGLTCTWSKARQS